MSDTEMELVDESRESELLKEMMPEHLYAMNGAMGEAFGEQRKRLEEVRYVVWQLRNGGYLIPASQAANLDLAIDSALSDIDVIATQCLDATMKGTAKVIRTIYNRLRALLLAQTTYLSSCENVIAKLRNAKCTRDGGHVLLDKRGGCEICAALKSLDELGGIPQTTGNQK